MRSYLLWKLVIYQKANYVPNALDTDYAALPEIIGAKLVAPAILDLPGISLTARRRKGNSSVQLASSLCRAL